MAERSKANLDLWKLFIAIVPLGFTYKVRIMTYASTVFNKLTFQKWTHLIALGCKFVCFVCFVALRPKSTAMVIAGRSVHLTTLFPGQA